MTPQILLGRVRRKLRPMGLRVRTARTEAQHVERGLFYVVNAETGEIVKRDVDIRKLAKEMGCSK